MPQIDISYSHDLNLDCPKLFETLETVIQNHDESAGACKARAYPVYEYHHQNIVIHISLLAKPHRDDDFMKGLLNSLQKSIEPIVSTNCYYAVDLHFMGPYYVTSKKE